MRNRLTFIHQPWRRLFVTIVINTFFFLSRLLQAHSRQRIHWIGKYSRPARPERAFIVLTFVSAMILLEPHDYAVWAMLIGGVTSCMVFIQSVFHIFARVRELD